jgi:hypothetical protein
MMQPGLPLESPKIAALMVKRERAHKRGQFATEKAADKAIYRTRHDDLRAFVELRKRQPKKGGR